MKITGSLIVCSAAALFTAGALLFDDGPTQTAPSYAATASDRAEIDIQDFAFSSLQVAPGTTVTVANRDSVDHTATSTNGAFDTGAVGAGHAVSFVAPAVPGTYQFVCAIHPSMVGQLVVG
jgi:plastocyanin